MPRYLFQIYDGLSEPDPIPVDLPGLDAVRTESIKTAGELIKELDSASGEEWRMEVTDRSGRLLLTFRFSVTEHGG